MEPGRVFWHRDLGLLTRGFRDLGHDAWLVVHPAKLRPRESKVRSEAGPPPPIPTSAAFNIKHPTSKFLDEPVLWVSPSEVRDPSWWQSQTPDLVVLGLWTRPKYDSIRRASLSATPRIIERADSDGMRTASCGLGTYARRRYDYFRDRTYRWPAIFSIPGSVLYSLASVLATPWVEFRLARTLRLLPALAVETPEATRLWKNLATKLRADAGRIHCIPHPIQTELFFPDPKREKRNRIIAVGRWESYQKNLPLLLRTLRSFLGKNQTWEALVVGTGLPPDSPHPRIRFSPPLDPAALASEMRSSKIFLSSSHYESFGLAAAEALACGCLSVGPKGLSSTEYFRSLTGMKPPRDDDLEAELEQVAAYVNQGLSPAAEGLLLARAALAPEKIAAALAERI